MSVMFRDASRSVSFTRGAPHTAKATRIIVRQSGLRPCFTPVKNPQGNGLSLAHCPRTNSGKWLALRAYAQARLRALEAIAGCKTVRRGEM